MALVNKIHLAALVVLGFIGGLIALGALSALTSDSPVGVKPLRYIWYQWVFEVFALLVTAGSIVVDFRRLRVLFVALITANTPLLSNTIDLALSLGADAPGSNGTALRANIAAAGVIVVVIANFLIILAAGLSYLDDEEGPSERKKSTQYETNKV